MVNFGEVTPDGLKATFSDDVIRTISLSRSGNILSYQGSWREALAIPLQLDDNETCESDDHADLYNEGVFRDTYLHEDIHLPRRQPTKMKVESGTVAEFTTTTTTERRP